jgi:hypothetical protein
VSSVSAAVLAVIWVFGMAWLFADPAAHEVDDLFGGEQ